MPGIIAAPPPCARIVPRRVVVRTLGFLVGIEVVGWALRSAVEKVVLPRSSRNTSARLIFRSTGTEFRFLANERRDFATRDRIMAFYAPVSLLCSCGVADYVAARRETITHPPGAYR